MCGRYTITITADSAREDLGLTGMPEGYQPRYNVAPTQPVAIVADAEERKAEWMRWGLIPPWAKDASIGSRLINARSETLIEKPSFRNAFAKRRCLILADGFYEWQKSGTPGVRPQPYYFKRADGKPFAFAGVWENWRSPEGEAVRSCALITTRANKLVKPVHERMPVMLSGVDMWAWLEETDTGFLMALLHPYPEEEMTAFPVSTQVNQTRLDVPDLIQPVAV